MAKSINANSSKSKSLSSCLIEKKIFILGLAFASLLAFLDLYSKKFIFNILDGIAFKENISNPQISVTSYFNLVKVWNKGVSFGMFNDLDHGSYIISFINIAIMVFLLIWLYRNKIFYLSLAISFIIGGAIGNLFDRLENGAVADFLDFYIDSYHWPAFNLADSFVFIGVTLLLLENFFIKKNEK